MLFLYILRIFFAQGKEERMEQENRLTSGNLFHEMMRFSIPYLIASFLQTFYGMADLFITGQFNSAAPVSAVSIGSQVTHMLTVIIVGLAMGTTVSISHAIGGNNKKQASRIIGNSVVVFALAAVIGTVLLLFNISNLLNLLQTPSEAMESAQQYLLICFIGIPFIVAYNVISSIYRGIGDTKSPMIFVAIAGVINIVLDYVFIGGFAMGAAGAALGTIISQAGSVILALIFSRKLLADFHIQKEDFRLHGDTTRKIFAIGFPISAQDGLIQISFLLITMIANSRGLAVSTAVGIVEKIISFLFLVPSAMLSTVSAITAQNVGAGKHDRGRMTLRYGIITCLVFGVIVFTVCQFFAPQIVSLFIKNEPEVVTLGGQYLRSYSLDCIFAGVHFCFSGYFSAYAKSVYSFAHNMISVVLVRVPGSWLASVYFPATLFPMGLAAPMGSLLSVGICTFLYLRLQKQIQTGGKTSFSETAD